jgi:peptidoglycan/xylan/chitin deacetylase (PgdA/CDA1 family)
MYFVKNPSILKKLYPSLIWEIPNEGNRLYLSFDDGPIPEVTPFVLSCLKEVNAKATFFCIGDNVRKHPAIFDEVVQAGHAIGNHTFNHLNGWYTATEAYLNNIEECSKYTSAQLFRPPYGRISPSQIKALKSEFPDTKIIMWDVLSGDFDPKLTAQDCFENVTQNAKSGSIVVFHDSLKAFQRLRDSLPAALKYWADKGFEFHTIN